MKGRKLNMKIISWNVAGFRACLNKGFSNFFNDIDADIFCLQEIKATQDQINFHPEGYLEYYNSALRKGYSGTLVYTKIKPLNVTYGINNDEYDNEGRVITLEYQHFFLVNVYVPNVKRTLERLPYRMKWEDLFKDYLNKLKQNKPVIVCGDFNVAHEEIDIKNAKQNIGNAGFTYEERAKFTNLLASGFIDSYRHLYPQKTDAYTWWSYMKNVREKNIGWRIDYFLLSQDLISKLIGAHIYSHIYGSDHCPIGIAISDKLKDN